MPYIKIRGRQMKKLVILILVLSFSAISAQILNFYEPETNDTRSEALGRTSILSSSKANFLFNNTSQLGFMKKKSIQVNCRANLGTYNRTVEDENDIYEDENDYPLHIKLNGISFAFPITYPNRKDLQIGLGIGYRTYYDFGYKRECESEYDDETYTLDSSGGFNIIVLGGGISYEQRIAGGISLSFPFSSSVETEEEYDDGEFYKSDFDLSGYFFTLSGSYKINDLITIAARLRTGYELEHEYSGNGTTQGYNMEIPYELGFATELRPNGNVSLFAEYLTRNFDDYEVFNYNPNGITDKGYSFRTGFEIGNESAFRGGFFMQSVPIYKKKYDDEFLEHDKNPLTEYGLTLGAGAKLNNFFTLDIAAAYSFLNYDDKVSESNYSYEYSKFKIGCSLAYQF